MTNDLKKLLGKAGYNEIQKAKWSCEMAICRTFDHLHAQHIIKSNIRETIKHLMILFRSFVTFSRIKTRRWYYDSANGRYVHRPK